MKNAADSQEEGLNASVYAELRRRLVTGRMLPGHELSTRSIAAELGVSQTPVRDALSRLAAEGAVSIRSKRRVRVPPMTQQRFEDLHACRLLLEPEAAVLALPYLTPQHVERLRTIDAELDAALANNDPDSYMSANHRFHFAIYSAAPRATLVQLIEAVWLQFGPFMRTVYDHLGNANVHDNHQAAISAIIDGNDDALRKAIAADIGDGMSVVLRKGLTPQVCAA